MLILFPYYVWENGGFMRKIILVSGRVRIQTLDILMPKSLSFLWALAGSDLLVIRYILRLSAWKSLLALKQAPENPVCWKGERENVGTSEDYLILLESPGFLQSCQAEVVASIAEEEERQRIMSLLFVLTGT